MQLKKKSQTEGFWTNNSTSVIVLSFATGFCLSFSSLISFLPGGTEVYKQLGLLTVYLKTLIAQSHNSSIHLLNLATTVNWARCQTGWLTGSDSNFCRTLVCTPHCIFVLFWSFSMSPGLTAPFMEKPHPSLINRFIQSSDRECCAWMPALVARWVTSLSFLVNCPFNAELINHTRRPCKHIFLYIWYPLRAFDTYANHPVWMMESSEKCRIEINEF